MIEHLPRWLRELRRFQLLRPQIYLYGNVHDCYYLPLNYRQATSADELGWVMFPDLRRLLQQYLRLEGYELICYYDEIDGMEISTSGQPMTKPELLALARESSRAAQAALPERVELVEGDVQRALGMFRHLLAGRRMLTATIVNYASRFAGDPNLLQRDERRLFLEMLKAAQEATVFPDRGGARNLLLLVCDKLNDVPPWLLVDNPLTRGIAIGRPERDERRRFFEIVARRQPANRFYEADGGVAAPGSEVAVDRTDGFTNRELENLVSLSRHERIPLAELGRLIDLYRYGERENFWEQLDPERVRGAERELSHRVLGQPRAVRKAVEILRRAQLGLDAIDRQGSNRPKGVLFFAGPTGVGKTELAKGLAALVFNDESALLRFDMSEYSDSNSAVKFIGAPPGYVGYEEGGQLTRRIAERPFSIVLFDEIEKAHPSVFDKFLQILDDGRLTDSKGETVYFSETLVVFTSNLGVFRDDDERPGRRVANVSIDDSYEAVSEAILSEIRAFFAAKLDRPEILNRFGDNFVVFDFIRPPIDGHILRKRLDVVAANLLARTGSRLVCDDATVELFRTAFVVDNLINGGRGINNRIETYVKNPLATFLFEHPEARGRAIRMIVDGAVVSFQCTGD